MRLILRFFVYINRKAIFDLEYRREFEVKIKKNCVRDLYRTKFYKKAKNRYHFHVPLTLNNNE
jgi:hypothetical protein